MKKIITVVGARPQFVKLAPLSKALRKEYQDIIVHTGQHYDDKLSDSFFNELRISSPNYNLDVRSASHGVQTGNMLIQLDEIFFKEKPDLVVVFGDTNSTLAGALSAVKIGIPVLHIEAGLRSNNRGMPEEINRVAVDHISDYLFAPTEMAVKHLHEEGLQSRSFLTGDIMVDALKNNIKRAKEKPGIFNKLQITQGNYFLLTLHRPYNVDNPKKLLKILKLIGKVEKTVVFPAHPRTKKIIKENRIEINKNIVLCDPQGYLDFIVLEDGAGKIITDSGGIQKEAYILKKPCITIRPETEWVETVSAGWNRLLQPEDSDFVNIINSFAGSDSHETIYGENVAELMLDKISTFLK